MIIGVPKEIKVMENRVALTPASASVLIAEGHTVLIESNAGLGSNFTDKQYMESGATIVPTAKDAWAAEMVMKVKEPIASEYDYFYKGQILFTYLHLAADEALTKALLEKEVVAIAYETVQLADGSLPLLAPMSEVAGRMAAQIGAHYLEKTNGGKGILLSGVPGVAKGNVTIIGGGVVGYSAAKIAVGLGANVTILDVNPARLRQLEEIFGDSIQTLISNSFNIAEQLKTADLVIGAVLIPGAKAPRLVTEDMVKDMQPASVIVDVAIDQGGIVETADHVTTHDHPTYEKHGVVHYAVGNMPGAVPKTSSMALTNVTLPYALQIAANGYKEALLQNEALRKGLNVYQGKITMSKVAEALQLPYESAEDLLKGQLVL